MLIGTESFTLTKHVYTILALEVKNISPDVDGLKSRRISLPTFCTNGIAMYEEWPIYSVPRGFEDSMQHSVLYKIHL